MEKIYQIQRPLIKSLPENDLINSKEVQEAVERAQKRYLPWKEFRLKSWVPEKKEHVWSLVKMYRRFGNVVTPIMDKDGSFYEFNPRSHVQFLHEIDLELGGSFMGVRDFSEGDKKQIIRRNLIEESIASSRLEGANTSRVVARKMLHEGRNPRNKDEKMIVNNHKVMERIEGELKYEPLTIDLLKDIHRQVTRGTLKDESLEGRLRETLDENGNRLKIMPWDEQVVTYVTPDREFVDQELSRLIDFANDKNTKQFIHPLTKAIMLHFWVGLLHPFEDGNGRLARILFYWYMLRKGYWAFSYLSLSECIIKSPKQYAMAYIYSEQDDYDLNYFIHYNVEKLKLARKQFAKYLQERIAENKKMVNLVKNEYHFNDRQLRLLQYLVKDEQRYTTPSSYHNINREIGYGTVHADLKQLICEGLLKKVKSGRVVYYYPTAKVKEIIG